MTLPRLERLVVELGQKKFVAGYIFSFIQDRGVTKIDEITPLSKLFRSQLVEKGFFISTLKIIEKLTDPDGTIKYVFGLPASALAKGEAGPDGPPSPPRFASQSEAVGAGNRIESVLLSDPVKSKRFPGLGPGNSKGISQGDDRRTLCVSTQVGCAMGCVFCATGRLGLARNLTAGEIVDQVNIVARDSLLVTRGTRAESRLTNVVFMGMGEPLENYDAVMDAVNILNTEAGLNIGIRRITVSTSGIPQAIERLAEEARGPRLAISLNAPTDAIRQKLMPIAKKHPLDRLLRAVAAYQRKTRNRVTFEYCLIKGVNDTSLQARLLVKLIRPFMCNVNLIEYNPPPLLRFAKQSDGGGFKPSGRDAIERFATVLKEAGVETTIRLKMGQTIHAACGQLGAGIK